MTDETKQMLEIHLSMLKTQMEKDGLVFGFAVDMEDINNSKLCIIDREKYLRGGMCDGIIISLTELNDGLL